MNVVSRSFDGEKLICSSAQKAAASFLQAPLSISSASKEKRSSCPLLLRHMATASFAVVTVYGSSDGGASSSASAEASAASTENESKCCMACSCGLILVVFTVLFCSAPAFPLWYHSLLSLLSFSSLSLLSFFSLLFSLLFSLPSSLC